MRRGYPLWLAPPGSRSTENPPVNRVNQPTVQPGAEHGASAHYGLVADTAPLAQDCALLERAIAPEPGRPLVGLVCVHVNHRRIDTA